MQTEKDPSIQYIRGPNLHLVKQYLEEIMSEHDIISISNLFTSRKSNYFPFFGGINRKYTNDSTSLVVKKVILIKILIAKAVADDQITIT